MKKKLRRIYNSCYNNSPKSVRSFLKKSTFALANKPFVKKPDIVSQNMFPSGCKAGFILSADFELGWAFRFSKTSPHPEKMALRSRNNFPFLIKVFNEYNIPITWATVGHLFLKHCKKGDHDWMHSIPYFENEHWRFNKGGWFDCDPYTSWEKAKTWYAPDLIESILGSNIPHEISCHSFSHIDFSDANCPREVAEDEIQACVDAAKEWGITFQSFIFPAGTYGNFEVLKQFGFTSYRKSYAYDLAYPFVDDNEFIVFPSSSCLTENDLGWTSDYFIRRYTKYIDKAIATQTLCHFWFHPSFDGWFLRNVFPGILEYAAKKREAGKLWIGTMSGLTDHIYLTR